MTPTAVSRDPRLAGLDVRGTEGGIGQLSPSFSPEVFRYSLAVQSDMQEIELAPRTSGSPPPALTVGGLATAGDAVRVAIAVGTTEITVGLRDAGGRAATYTLRVTRADPSVVAGQFQKLTFTDPATGITMGYRLFVPRPLDPGRTYPVVLFLHGAGESGSDNDVQLTANEGATVWAGAREQARRACASSNATAFPRKRVPPGQSATKALRTDATPFVEEE